MRYDFHVHSDVSFDCGEPMANTIQAAITAGLDGICFTDHCDLIDGEVPGQIAADAVTNWERSYAAIETARAAFGDQIEILHGIELSEMTQDAERAKACTALPGLDFVLGAVHSVTGYQDFYFLDYPDAAFCRKLAELYIDENIRMAELNLMDAIAHIGYCNRYMAQRGLGVDLMVFEDGLRHLFRTLVQNGRGIELNTSGLRRNPGPNNTIPELPVLKLFRECGGEIVTLGSDAHQAKHVGSHLAEGAELLRTAGFGYTTIFRARKPTFIKL